MLYKSARDNCPASGSSTNPPPKPPSFRHPRERGEQREWHSHEWEVVSPFSFRLEAEQDGTLRHAHLRNMSLVKLQVTRNDRGVIALKRMGQGRQPISPPGKACVRADTRRVMDPSTMKATSVLQSKTMQMTKTALGHAPLPPREAGEATEAFLLVLPLRGFLASPLRSGKGD